MIMMILEFPYLYVIVQQKLCGHIQFQIFISIIQWMAMALRGHLPNCERLIHQKDDILHQ